MAEEFTTNRFDSDDNEVTRALAGLKRVNAPNDFDFKVKARIAKGRPVEGSRLFPVWAKAAVPLALVLGVGGFLGVRYAYDRPEAEPPMVAAAAPPAVLSVSRPAEQPAPGAPTIQSDPVTAPRSGNATVAAVRRPSKPKQPVGGSVDSAVTVANSIELADVPLSDALQRSGVSGKVDAGAVKVESADSKTGLKSGDVIEAVNGKAVQPSTTIKGRLAGKTLRVRRDGQVIEVVVKN